ncbi:hypothetical protein ACFYKT_18190 [Cytobacillus sp. FJAT-53684]|uniref:Uncharacterized protein n=1 Tax=Cytobacillus mangrovibacter TaxID=3299024 RepID=A0ABW6K252_9BACI
MNKDMDISLFEQKETEQQFIFTISDSIVLEQLYGFLKYQFLLYNQEEPYKECFDSVLKRISECVSFKDIEEIAEEKSYPCFQRSVIDDEIEENDWHWLKVEYSIWLMFAEGKIFMEAYNNFLRFIEHQVRVSGYKWSISGAFRCFIH